MYKFGGVPISVAMPPIEALYAIDISHHFEKSLPLGWPAITLKAMGSIITVVAVFDSHILNIAVATMKPPTK